MTVLEIKKRLIKRINHTDNSELLEEMFRLIENEEAQDQYKKGETLTNEQANSEIDEWLGK